MTDLGDTIRAEYGEQIRFLSRLLAVIIALSLLGGTIGFTLSGFPIDTAVSNSFISFTLGGGSLNATGIARIPTIFLSLGGVVFISLTASIVMLLAQKRASMGVAMRIFNRELDALDREVKKNPP